MKHYQAPWSTSLVVVSSLVTVLCIGIAVGMIWSDRDGFSWLAVLPLAIVGGAAPFAIRGYSLSSEALWVHRLFWTTRLPLADLQSARFAPDVMRGSIRAFGNGGLFSFSGFFYSKALGGYRAWVTDPHRTVVLRFAARTVVVSPGSPEEFVRDIGMARGVCS